MTGIRFGSKHSWNDYGLVLTSKDIQSPSVKTMTVDITGGDGVLDFTDYFNEPKFNNRQLTFVFSKGCSKTEHKTLWSQIQNDLAGQKVSIIDDEDPDFHFTGRITVAYTREKNITKVTFTCDCEPYKLKNVNTVVSGTGSGDYVLSNLRKKVVPTITVTESTTIVFGRTTKTISAGSWVVPEYQLDVGDNIFTVTTEGDVTFTYREGGF